MTDGTRGGGDSDQATNVALAAKTLDTVARWEESVEALNKGGVASEERRYTVNDTRCVDSVERARWMRVWIKEREE